GWAIIVGAVLPLPFDIIGILAGFIKMNPLKFFVYCLIGKIVEIGLFVFVLSRIITVLLPIIRERLENIINL
ncbi:MAG: hypothetical protein LBQ91_03345, partial [Oscillospiraceae bacterium]|nr:hypothetical protein [Oscillospiraceae bacterium]